MSKKRLILISLIAVMIISVALAVPLFQVVFQKPIIGTIKGAEWQFIEIDGVTYTKSSDHEFSGADRGEYLGSVTNGDTTMRVFSVKEDDSERFIYTLWDWEGAFYARED